MLCFSCLEPAAFEETRKDGRIRTFCSNSCQKKIYASPVNASIFDDFNKLNVPGTTPVFTVEIFLSIVIRMMGDPFGLANAIYTTDEPLRSDIVRVIFVDNYEALFQRELGVSQTSFRFNIWRQAILHQMTPLILKIIGHGYNVRSGNDAAMILSCTYGYTTQVHLLLGMGAVVNVNRNEALYQACFHGHVEIIGILLNDSGMQIDPVLDWRILSEPIAQRGDRFMAVINKVLNSNVLPHFPNVMHTYIGTAVRLGNFTAAIKLFGYTTEPGRQGIYNDMLRKAIETTNEAILNFCLNSLSIRYFGRGDQAIRAAIDFNLQNEEMLKIITEFPSFDLGDRVSHAIRLALARNARVLVVHLLRSPKVGAISPETLQDIIQTAKKHRDKDLAYYGLLKANSPVSYARQLLKEYIPADNPASEGLTRYITEKLASVEPPTKIRK